MNDEPEFTSQSWLSEAFKDGARFAALVAATILISGAVVTLWVQW